MSAIDSIVLGSAMILLTSAEIKTSNFFSGFKHIQPEVQKDKDISDDLNQDLSIDQGNKRKMKKISNNNLCFSNQ